MLSNDKCILIIIKAIQQKHRTITNEESVAHTSTWLTFEDLRHVKKVRYKGQITHDFTEKYPEHANLQITVTHSRSKSWLHFGPITSFFFAYKSPKINNLLYGNLWNKLLLLEELNELILTYTLLFPIVYLLSC